MKRDMDLFRALLLKIEEQPFIASDCNLHGSDKGSSEVSYLSPTKALILRPIAILFG